MTSNEDTMTTPEQSPDPITQAITALTAAARRTRVRGAGTEHAQVEPVDFAEIACHVLTTVAANVGGVEALLAGRPGSWEADYVRQIVHRRTEPVRLVLDVEVPRQGPRRPRSAHQRAGPDRQPRPLLAAPPSTQLALATRLGNAIRPRCRQQSTTKSGLTASPCPDEKEPEVEKPGRPADHARPSRTPTSNHLPEHPSRRSRNPLGVSRLSRSEAPQIMQNTSRDAWIA